MKDRRNNMNKTVIVKMKCGHDAISLNNPKAVEKTKSKVCRDCQHDKKHKK